MIVVDTNVIAYLLIKGSHTVLAEAVFSRDPRWAAPLLWRSEFRSVLAGYVKRGQMSVDEAKDLMADAEAALQGREYNVDSARTLELADISGCTACDCEFVALAGSLGVPLVTSDAEVLRAFPSVAVSMMNFAE